MFVFARKSSSHQAFYCVKDSSLRESRSERRVREQRAYCAPSLIIFLTICLPALRARGVLSDAQSACIRERIGTFV